MAIIRVNDTIIRNADVTSSSNMLGIKYVTDMALDQLVNMYDEETSHEVYFLNEDGTTQAIYKNHKLTSIRFDSINNVRAVTIVLQVENIELKEADQINEQLNLQATKIATQEAEIESLKNALDEATVTLGKTQEYLEEAQAANNMLTECVLELSAVVYA